jgi:hypothetical protein
MKSSYPVGPLGLGQNAQVKQKAETFFANLGDFLEKTSFL